MALKFPYSLSAHAAKVIAGRGIMFEWMVKTLENPERVEGDESDPLLQHALAKTPEYDGGVLRVNIVET
ncbi:MAG: DUF4258 domain-containing protein [Pseudomonadota bacterium]